MDFDFTDEQDQLRDAVQRWVEKGFGFERRHALAKAGGFTRPVLGELADLGLAGLVVPEAHGGMGFGPVEAMVVMEELGRGLVNAPYAAAALASPCLLAAAPEAVQADWLPKIASGEALVVPAQLERGARYRLNHVATQASREGDGWQITGHKSVVAAADEADAFIVSARLSGDADSAAGIGLFIVERHAAGVEVRGYPTQDGARAGEVVLEAAPATLVCEDALATLELAQDVTIAAACAEGVGAMDKLLAITVEYMNTRKQFGTTLASFQALRHRIADVKMQLELARSMSYYASLKLGEAAPVRRRAIAQAKYQLGQSMRFVGQPCIQLHGGTGATDGHAGSPYCPRPPLLALTVGDSLRQLGEVSARMQDTAGVFA